NTMSEELDSIREELESLREHLQTAESVAPEIRERLTSTLREVDQALAASVEYAEDEYGSAAIGEHPHTLEERLSDAVLQFEESHPVLAGALERLIALLGQSGL
ncbi:MAG: DUF4404 family protein, partial [Planctomycetales bacterium]